MKMEFEHTDINKNTNVNNLLEKQSSKNSSGEVDIKSNKGEQKIRKEFSKLHKENRDNLNVSIEMCKKTRSTSKLNVLPPSSSSKLCEIDENTSAYFNNEKETVKEVPKQYNNDDDHKNTKSNSCKVMQDVCEEGPLQEPASNQENNRDTSKEINIETISSSKREQTHAHNATESNKRCLFHKRSALHPNSIEVETVKTINHIVDSNTTENDNIEIKIKVGNTVTNILIKKNNDVKVHVNTDRVLQKSLASYDVFVNDKGPSAQNAAPNIVTNIEEIRQSQIIDKNNVLNENNKQIERTQDDNNNEDTLEDVISGTNEINTPVQIIEYCNQKHSKNVFSACVEKENENNNVASNEKMSLDVPPLNIEDFSTPGMSCNIKSTGLQANNDIEMMNDDSDKSVVEVLQKTASFSKTKQISNGATKKVNQPQMIELSEQRVPSNQKASEPPNRKSIDVSVINITDTSIESTSSHYVTANDVIDRKTMGTPPAINKFVKNIQHNSTPNAKESLYLESQNIVDLDPKQTLCPTNNVAKATLKKEKILSKAFDKTPTSPAVKCVGIKSLRLKNKKYKIAGSCLTSIETSKLRKLCARHKWSYSNKYAKDLTHLVVAVDDDKKSQRSAKFMCALASSIWIVSYEWVEKCLQSKNVIDEEYFEALDKTGEPGPRRSRLATEKVFQGITFYCMEPFSELDIKTLKVMLEAAGGRVVKKAKEVMVTDENSSPSLLLAEPKNTREDRCIFLAKELGIVPVNYEWALKCLGSYSLKPIQESLLCPAYLMPQATENWPEELQGF